MSSKLDCLKQELLGASGESDHLKQELLRVVEQWKQNFEMVKDCPKQRLLKALELWEYNYRIMEEQDREDHQQEIHKLKARRQRIALLDQELLEPHLQMIEDAERKMLEALVLLQSRYFTLPLIRAIEEREMQYRMESQKKQWSSILISSLGFNRPKLIRPPGTGLLAITDFFFSKKTQEKVFEPVVAEIQDEYFAALDKKRFQKALWIRVRLIWSFWVAVLTETDISQVAKLIQKLISSWRGG